jgi:lysozyme
MNAQKSTFDLMVKVEGLELTAYKCTKGVWTIGIGNTYYSDGSKVKQGDKITKEKAIELFFVIAKEKEKSISKLLKKGLNQNQYDVVFSICWQYGASWLAKSKFLKQINIDPNNIKEISRIFDLMEYENRRKIELKHYIS